MKPSTEHRKISAGAVAAGHQATLTAAVQALEMGGNAFDAAVAALACSFVAEPCMSSPAGGFYASFRHGEEHGVLDAFCYAPEKQLHPKAEFFPIDVHFGAVTEQFHIGSASAAVPGAVAGLFALHERFCSLDLKDLFKHAISSARNGLVVDAFQAQDFELLEPILRHDFEQARSFFFKDRLIEQGEWMVQENLARFLEELCAEGRDYFYQSKHSADALKQLRAEGGLISSEDLASFEVKWRKPVELKINNWTLVLNGSPSSGASGVGLNLAQWLSDPGISRAQALFRSERLMHDQVVDDIAARSRDMLEGPVDFGSSLLKSPGGTTHFSIIDAEENAVSLTSSNGQGSGRWIADRGVQWNNMLGEGALFPGGLGKWSSHEWVSSRMSPCLAFNDEGDCLALGTGGAGRIPGALSQVLRNLFFKDMDLSEAVQAPRMHWNGESWQLEPHLSSIPRLPVINSIIPQNHWPHQDMYFGGVHACLLKNGQYSAVGDARRLGRAAVLGHG